MPLILNEPQEDSLHSTHAQLLRSAVMMTKPTIDNHPFPILPLTEQATLPLTQPASPSRHPTYLLNHFPHRPHFYQPESVGAQAGYCLSPVPPSLRQFTNPPPTTANAHPSCNPLSGNNTSTATHQGRPSHFLVSSAALSSLPSLSTTIASSSSSSSTSPLSSTSLSKPSSEPPSNTHNIPLLKPQPSAQQHHPSSAATMIITKKVLPVPPSLSPRVRQIFMDKINSQQAQSCAQLPRRKKKKAVDPLVPSI